MFIASLLKEIIIICMFLIKLFLKYYLKKLISCINNCRSKNEEVEEIKLL